MNWYLLFGLILIVLFRLFMSNSGFSENFIGGFEHSHEMCHLMAGANCRIPTWQLSDCWLNAYRECAGMCKGNLANCPCYIQASEMCRSRDDPAEGCYSSTYQKCMAGRVPGFCDPDRHH